MSNRFGWNTFTLAQGWLKTYCKTLGSHYKCAIRIKKRQDYPNLQIWKESMYLVFCGIPQGSILGPLLFLLHFNGAYLPLKHCKILMYADDTVLYYAHKEVNVIEGKLTEDLLRLSE